MITALLVYLAFGFGLAIGFNVTASKFVRVGIITLLLIAVTWPYALWGVAGARK